MLNASWPVSVQHLSNKRLWKGMDWHACGLTALGHPAADARRMILTWLRTLRRARSLMGNGLRASGVRTDIRARNSNAKIFGAFLQPNEMALDPRRVRKLRKEPLAAEHPEET